MCIEMMLKLKRAKVLQDRTLLPQQNFSYQNRKISKKETCPILRACNIALCVSHDNLVKTLPMPTTEIKIMNSYFDLKILRSKRKNFQDLAPF